MTDQRTASHSSQFIPDWDALARYVSGESGAEEAEDIRRFLQRNPQDREVLDGLSRLLEPTPARTIPADEVERALAEARRRRDTTGVLPMRPGRGRGASRFVSGTPWVSIAAGVTVLLAGALLYQRASDKAALLSNTVAMTHRTGSGSADSVRLPDGSRVVLAPRSELIVSADYGKTGRDVELHGVAYFDVIHDDSRPFAVRSGGATIRDVGTVFTVRADSGGSLRVAVQEGAVLVQRTGVPDDQGVLLHQGDLATMAPGEPVIARRGVVNADDVAWTTGRLVFRDATMGDVASELRRWYGVELRVADSSIATRHLTAEFQGESLDQIVSELTLALDAGVERRGDTLVVRSRGGRR
jgi:transmembrane sensor